MTFPANCPGDRATTEPVRRCRPWASAHFGHCGSVSKPRRFCAQRPARRARQELDPSAARPDSCSLRARPQVFRRSLDQSGYKHPASAGVRRYSRFRFSGANENVTPDPRSAVRMIESHTRQESIMDRANRRDSFWLRFPMPNAREPDGNRTPCSRVRGPRDRPLWNRLRGRSAHIHGHGRRS